MFAKLIQRIRSIRLIWKLLIPFLFLSFFGNATLAYIGLSSQLKMIKKEEQEEIHNFHHLFMAKMDHKKRQALSLATTIASNPQIQSLLANQDRDALANLLSPMFQTLKREFEIAQFHFHTVDGDSFLRLHMLEKSGESISYRKTIRDVMHTGKGLAGLERGSAGLGIRGIAPIFYDDALVGTVEIGYPFGTDFLQGLKLKWGPDFTVYEKNGDHSYICLATTLNYCDQLRLVHYLKNSEEEAPTIVISPPNYPDKSFTLGPIRDYGGNVVALAKIEKDRSDTIGRLKHTRNLMVLVGLVGIFVSFGVVWLVAAQFTRPIAEIVKKAKEIAEEKREIHLPPRPEDEIGLLTRSLNSMLESLKQRRMQLEDYARTLEKRVEKRTAELVSSEEKYRTLVENLPLVVYRLLKDGSVEFINPYFTEKLGYSIEEIVGDRNFWSEKIFGQSKSESKDFFSGFEENGKEYRTERALTDTQGHLLTFIDRMIPMRDDQGNLAWIDGIMLDISELKKLQERALKTEEIRVLGEISARFAHEIRNPLVTAGGFASRLHDSLPEKSKSRKLAKIIVEEVSRLEKILRIMLVPIEPFSLSISEFDLNQLLRMLLDETGDIIKEKRIRVEESLSPALPKLHCDEGLLSRAFESLISDAILSIQEEEGLYLSTIYKEDHILVTIRYKEEGLSKEDLEQYFFPRFTNNGEASSVEKPLCKVIIHRHGGKIDVSGEEGDIVVIKIELPIDLKE